MDEIDIAVDNLFGQYVAKRNDVAAVPSEPPPSTGPELDANSTIKANSHPDIISKQSRPQPDIIKKPAAVPRQKAKVVAKAAAKTRKNVVAKAGVKTQKTVATKNPVKKKVTGLVPVAVDIIEIKKQTAKMLRHLHKAIKSENWWHKLYYANKFLFIAMSISKTVTKREKQA